MMIRRLEPVCRTYSPWRRLVGHGKGRGVPAQLSSIMRACAILVTILTLFSGVSTATAAELEADAWPENDIWIKLDDIKRDRLYILFSFTEEPTYQYEETASASPGTVVFTPIGRGELERDISTNRLIHPIRAKRALCWT